MTQAQATVWLYGEGGLQLHVSAPKRMQLTVLADGRLVDRRVFTGKVVTGTTLSGMRWHSLLFIASERGLRLDEIAF
jgi:hypothetical protein